MGLTLLNMEPPYIESLGLQFVTAPINESSLGTWPGQSANSDYLPSSAYVDRAISSVESRC